MTGKLNVLLVGSGGREHALAWKISRSPLLGKLHAIPGSAAIADHAECARVSPLDFGSVVSLCRAGDIGLVVVGPEDPLAAGLADALRGEGLKVYGPGRAAARLESSKAFAKDFMRRHGIPTAASKELTDPDAAAREAGSFGFPVVVKADGLAAGKGVRICSNEAEALDALEAFMRRGVFGDAGKKVVVEECLVGKETTFMGLCDGEAFLELPPSSDHKRLRDADEGPNTGGMGVFAPTPAVDEALKRRIRSEIVDKTLAGMKADGLEFRGTLYCGLILTADGPKVLEFNVRFGDPETQAVLPLLKSDLLELMLAAAEGRLAGKKLTWDGASVCVVLASEGYPEKPVTGREITGLDAPAGDDSVVFHAGTAREDGRWLTKGGRVLGAVGLGAGIADARRKAYALAETIRFEGAHYRRDIAAAARKEALK